MQGNMSLIMFLGNLLFHFALHFLFSLTMSTSVDVFRNKKKYKQTETFQLGGLRRFLLFLSPLFLITGKE